MGNKQKNRLGLILKKEGFVGMIEEIRMNDEVRDSAIYWRRRCFGVFLRGRRTVWKIIPIIVSLLSTWSDKVSLIVGWRQLDWVVVRVEVLRLWLLRGSGEFTRTQVVLIDFIFLSQFVHLVVAADIDILIGVVRVSQCRRDINRSDCLEITIIADIIFLSILGWRCRREEPLRVHLTFLRSQHKRGQVLRAFVNIELLLLLLLRLLILLLG